MEIYLKCTIKCLAFERRKKEKFVLRPGGSGAGRTLVLDGSRLFVSELLVEATTSAEKHKAVREQLRAAAETTDWPCPWSHSAVFIHQTGFIYAKNSVWVHSRREHESKLTSHPGHKSRQASESAGAQTHWDVDVTWQNYDVSVTLSSSSGLLSSAVSGSCFRWISGLRLDVMTVRTSVQRAESDADLWPLAPTHPAHTLQLHRLCSECSTAEQLDSWGRGVPAMITESRPTAVICTTKCSKQVTGRRAGICPSLWECFILKIKRMLCCCFMSDFLLGDELSCTVIGPAAETEEVLLLQKSSDYRAASEVVEQRDSSEVLLPWRIRDGPNTDLVEVSG